MAEDRNIIIKKATDTRDFNTVPTREYADTTIPRRRFEYPERWLVVNGSITFTDILNKNKKN